MKPEITDISYSTVLTFELVTQYDFLTLGAPTFPSLRKDAIYKTDPTRDGIILFLQYKLGDHITGTNSSLKDFWGVPYYRFIIHPQRKIKRHKLLANLELMNLLVYYTVPEFHTIGGLHESLMKKTVLANSTFWSPSGVGMLTEKQKNTVSYKRDINYGILEPGNIKIERLIKGETLLHVLREKYASTQSEKIDDNRLVQLGDQMLENYLEIFHSVKERRLVNDIKTSRDQIDARDYLSMISTLLYDCYVYIVTG
jgi:hypothetical protein